MFYSIALFVYKPIVELFVGAGSKLALVCGVGCWAGLEPAPTQLLSSPHG